VHDPTLLDGFPLYWVEKLGLKKPRSLEDLSPPDHEVCGFLSSLGAVFITVELIKFEYYLVSLNKRIGTPFPFLCFRLSYVYLSLLGCLLIQTLTYCVSCAYMVLNEEKRRKLAELTSKRKAALAKVGTSTPVGTPPVATAAPISPEPAPTDQRQKVVVEAIASEYKDTCTSFVFKRKRAANVVAPSHSASDGHAPSFKENPLSASSPRDLIVLEGGGRTLLEVILECLPLLSCPPSFRRFSKPSKAGKWMARANIPLEGVRPEVLGPSLSHPVAPQLKHKN